jgi:drug/metabolite transporter (DMT)-like permease
VTATLLAVLSAALYGTGDFLGGLATRRASMLPAIAVAQLSGFVTLLIVLPFLPARATPVDLLWGGVAGIAGGAGLALLYRALAEGRMSVIAPITAACSIAVPVIVGVAVGERPSVAQVAGIGVAVLAIALVSREQAHGEGDAPARRALLLALSAGVVIGVFLVALARTAPAAGLIPLLTARVVSLSGIGAVALITRQRVALPRGVMRLGVAAGVADSAANACYVLAAQHGLLSLVATLSSLYPASTVLLARVVLGERLNHVQLAGVALALAAVVLIAGGGGW